MGEFAAADADRDVDAAAEGAGEEGGGAGGEEENGTAELELGLDALWELDPPGLDEPTLASFRWN